ncbi:MAG: helix-turn-helix domain-containing protein [Chthoniobacterales bacterium]
MISILGEKEALKKLGERLRGERLRRNLSQSYVATLVKITIPTYRKIEKGDSKVAFRHMARTLGFFGYSEALGNVIPELPVELALKDLLAPERKHASGKRQLTLGGEK